MTKETPVIHNTNTSSKPHLIVVDDDARLRNLLKQYLSEHGFLVSSVKNAAEARKVLSLIRFDLMILDVMMPDETGIEFTRALRLEENDLPILMLTAMGEVDKRIEGLEVGADEYLAKPFEPKELLLRIRSILKRTQKEEPLAEGEIKIGRFVYDSVKGRLRDGDKIIALTAVEARLLQVFVENCGVPLTREEIALQCGIPESSRTIDVQITRLRRKLQDDPKLPTYIQTVRHVGYVLIKTP